MRENSFLWQEITFVRIPVVALYISYAQQTKTNKQGSTTTKKMSRAGNYLFA